MSVVGHVSARVFSFELLFVPHLIKKRCNGDNLFKTLPIFMHTPFFVSAFLLSPLCATYFVCLFRESKTCFEKGS